MTKNPVNKTTEDMILLDTRESKQFLRWVDFE